MHHAGAQTLAVELSGVNMAMGRSCAPLVILAAETPHESVPGDIHCEEVHTLMFIISSPSNSPKSASALTRSLVGPLMSSHIDFLKCLAYCFHL